MHGFRDNEVLLQAEYDVIMISLPEGRCTQFLIADSERATPTLYSCSIDTFCLSYTRRLDVLVRIRLLEVAPRIREIYTSCDFFLFSFLPSCLFFLPHLTGRTDRDNFTYNGSKDAVWHKEVPSQQVFFSHLTFWGYFAPKPPKFRRQLGNPTQIKSRIMSKPFKIDKKCQLNMNIKSGSPFQNP